MRFGAMLALALAGLWLVFMGATGLGNAYGMRFVLLVYALTQAGVVIAYHVFGRLRAPIYPVLAILGAVPLSVMLRPCGSVTGVRCWLRAAWWLLPAPGLR